jgi:adenylate kinase
MIVLFGPTGSGKSVQGKLMAERHGWRWLSAGELLRAANDSDITKRQKAGQMIPDDIVNAVVFAEIDKIPTASEERKIVLDGYPRHLQQAEALSRHELDRLGREPVDIIIDIHMTRREIFRRLELRGRMEDDLATIKKRLRTHTTQTRVIKKYYRKLGVPIVRIDGVGTVGQVHDRIEQKLELHRVIGEF